MYRNLEGFPTHKVKSEENVKPKRIQEVLYAPLEDKDALSQFSFEGKRRRGETWARVDIENYKTLCSYLSFLSTVDLRNFLPSSTGGTIYERTKKVLYVADRKIFPIQVNDTIKQEWQRAATVLGFDPKELPKQFGKNKDTTESAVRRRLAELEESILKAQRESVANFKDLIQMRFRIGTLPTLLTQLENSSFSLHSVEKTTLSKKQLVGLSFKLQQALLAFGPLSEESTSFEGEKPHPYFADAEKLLSQAEDYSSQLSDALDVSIKDLKQQLETERKRQLIAGTVPRSEIQEQYPELLSKITDLISIRKVLLETIKKTRALTSRFRAIGRLEKRVENTKKHTETIQMLLHIKDAIPKAIDETVHKLEENIKSEEKISHFSEEEIEKTKQNASRFLEELRRIKDTWR